MDPPSARRRGPVAFQRVSDSFEPPTPPNYPPPQASGGGQPLGAPPPGVPSFGAPPPGHEPPVHEAPNAQVPAYGAPPPVGGHESVSPDQAVAGVGVLAGFGSRLGALMLDGVIFTILSLVLAAPFGIFLATQYETEIGPCTVNGRERLCEAPTDVWIGLLLIALAAWFLLTLVALFFYYIRPIAKSGQTVGRRMLNIKVVSTDTGEPPTLGGAFVRYIIASVASGSVCYLGYLWMLWDDRNQTWHDKVASTVVVQN